ncbi:hypothetical protein P7C71_g3739, partial [Lecanoromycetidae sp. Uapishka_2]
MRKPKDDFKWFGEGFDGFPKCLPEDCVEYAIYVIDLKLNDLEIQQHLREVQVAATKFTSELLKGFIWQQESFQLEVKREDGRRLLYGRTSYGDSVDDEWLIVYILRELSRRFPMIWIRISDTDGQFLLIEAANALPSWINPEIADFRVWLNRGNLLLIPLGDSEVKMKRVESEPKSLDLQQAVKYIENQSPSLVHSAAIEAEAFYRLQKYPQQILDSLHHALITIPRKLAYILHDSPAHISYAVEAFYLRDPIALRSLQATSPSVLKFPPSDFVTVSTACTRVGYAQMKSQQFDPPTIWAEALSSERDVRLRESLAMGMKVTCGFEMLISDPQNQDKKAVREMKILLDDLQQGSDELPRDAEISKWGRREDDERWLDIDFTDFERELGGKQAQFSPAAGDGFGDTNAQDTLRKMVSRFEDFLSDDNAGAEGAEYMDDMDHDDDEDSTSSDDGDTEGEDKDISFNEGDFTSMMKEMMGLPSVQAKAENSDLFSKGGIHQGEQNFEVSSDEGEEREIQQAMQAVETELREAGALDLDQTQTHDGSKSQPSLIRASSESPNIETTAEGGPDGDDLDIDFNLAKNLLESFKSQGGASGPGSNLIGLMGLRVPRDEHSGHS